MLDFDLNLFGLSITADQAGRGSLCGYILECGARRALKKEKKQIYYNQISLWSKLKEDVKMESRLNVA